jgi:hypothetical protein
MANDFGFNFRNTSGYVTDPSYATYVLPNTNYPTTRSVNGVSLTFGWESSAGILTGRDRSTSVDARLAGIFFTPNNGTGFATFRLDLPSTGIWTFALAQGDGAGGNSQNNFLQVKNTSSLLATYNTNTTATKWSDTASNTWTSAQWPGSNVTANLTFTTTICRVTLTAQSSSNSNTIAHFRVTQVIPKAPGGLALMGVQ